MPLNAKGDYQMNPQRGRAMEDKPAPKGEVVGSGGAEKTHTITEHADGSMQSKMHDGTETEHPDHLHMMAHMGHSIAGGKHHIAHHDGMGMRTHGVGEDGQHEETQDQNSAEDAKEALGRFFNEEAQEPEHQEQHGAEPKIDGGY